MGSLKYPLEDERAEAEFSSQSKNVFSQSPIAKSNLGKSTDKRRKQFIKS